MTLPRETTGDCLDGVELRGKREVRKSASQFKIKIRTCKLFKLPGI